MGSEHTTIRVSRDVHEELRDYKFEQRHESMSSALRELLEECTEDGSEETLKAEA